MFILRSAFWLTLAFIIMAPRAVDLGAAAGDLSARAVAAGQQLVVGQALAAPCESLHCLGGKAIAAALSSPSVAPTMQDSPTAYAPVPRPRPDWLG